jgi:hypothetical protein
MDTFASQHANPSLGWRAWPRWFRRTDFWLSLKAEHRAILDELYQRMASAPGVQKRTGVRYERGEWPIGEEALAKASGTTRKQVRAAITRAKAAGIISKRKVTFREPGRTIHMSLFKWLDFDSYDIPNTPMGQPQGHSPGQPLGLPPGLPEGQVRHNGKTHGQDTSQDTNPNTPSEELAAARLGVLPPAPSMPQSVAQGSASGVQTEQPLPEPLDKPWREHVSTDQPPQFRYEDVINSPNRFVPQRQTVG